MGAAEPSGLAGAWAALIAAHDAVAAEVESGALAAVHAEAELLPKLAETLLARSSDLEASKRARVEGAVKQIARVADGLHEAADAGDAARTRKSLERLDGLLALIRAQYPEGTLSAASPTHDDGHAGQAGSPHAHAERPAGVVDREPRATLLVRALDPFRFAPERLELEAGVPTRIELENDGAIEHSLVVKTPDGSRDWIHLHVPVGATDAATYELDRPGTYPVLCTIAGHTEAGMVGELVVREGSGWPERQRLRDMPVTAAGRRAYPPSVYFVGPWRFECSAAASGFPASERPRRRVSLRRKEEPCRRQRTTRSGSSSGSSRSRVSTGVGRDKNSRSTVSSPIFWSSSPSRAEPSPTRSTPASKTRAAFSISAFFHL